MPDHYGRSERNHRERSKHSALGQHPTVSPPCRHVDCRKDDLSYSRPIDARQWQARSSWKRFWEFLSSPIQKESFSLYNPRRGRCSRRAAAYAEHIPENAQEMDSDPDCRRCQGSVVGFSLGMDSKDLGEQHLGQMKTQLAPMCQKLTLALLTGLSIALLAGFALPAVAHGKGHGHSGGHGVHHRAHHGGSSGLWRQSSGSASPGAGNTPTDRPGGVGQPGHLASPAPTLVLPSPTDP